MNTMRKKTIPVKIGDIIEGKISAMGEKGDGILTVNKYVIFVPNTKLEQKVKIRVTGIMTKVGFAEVIE